MTRADLSTLHCQPDIQAANTGCVWIVIENAALMNTVIGSE